MYCIDGKLAVYSTPLIVQSKHAGSIAGPDNVPGVEVLKADSTTISLTNNTPHDIYWLVRWGFSVDLNVWTSSEYYGFHRLDVNGVNTQVSPYTFSSNTGGTQSHQITNSQTNHVAAAPGSVTTFRSRLTQYAAGTVECASAYSEITAWGIAMKQVAG